MKHTPKPLQVQAFMDIGQAVKEGVKRIVLQAPCGVGKTFIAAMIAEGALKKGNKITFTAPYTSLIDQTVDRFMAEGLPEPGVMQGDHELTDRDRPLQIATVQTLGRRCYPDCKIVIIDECHLQFKTIIKWMELCPDAIFIGLSATPWARGMGERYQRLIGTKSLRQCLDDGELSPYEVYGVDKPDVSKVPMAGDDFHQGKLAEVMRGFKLVGNVVGNWLKNGEDRQTIVFCVNIMHANEVANRFESAGVRVAVITQHVKMKDRKPIYETYENKEIRMIISVGCLVAGFDSYVDCIIWARPTKSPMTFVQSCGRGLRISPGKDCCLIFCHAGTFTIMGYLEDVDEAYSALGLDDLSKKESSAVRKAIEEKIKKPKDCPSCKYTKPAGINTCPKCGFTPRVGEDIDTDDTRELKKLKGKKEPTKEEKQDFYSQAVGFYAEAINNGKKWGEGWIAHKYKDKFGVWPKGLKKVAKAPTPEFQNWITYQHIKYAKGKKR